MGIVLGVIVGVLMSLVAGPQAGILGLAILALYGIVGAFVLASLGASVFAASIALVAASVASIFTAMQGVTDSLAQLSGEQFMAAAMGIASMGAAIRALPVVKTVMLKTVFDSAAAFQTSATIAAAALGQKGMGTNVNVTSSPNINIHPTQTTNARGLTKFVQTEFETIVT